MGEALNAQDVPAKKSRNVSSKKSGDVKNKYF
jgi:hypothetical protein